MTPPAAIEPAGDPGCPGRDFLALIGPTAVGKTALSLALAEALGGEIVSMDSRQVYRGMDVGTAKASAAERARVPHHGLDLVEPDERYSAGRFAREARGWIRDIRSRARIPLLVGGTGFFLRALTDPLFREPEMEPERREALRGVLEGWGRARLEAWARRLDPDRAEVAAEGGPQRLSRTLEVALLTGRPLSWWHEHGTGGAAPLAGPIVVLERPREELDARILARTEAMFDGGLLDEVRGLLDRGFRADDPGMTGVGYREAVKVLRGEWRVEDAVEAVATSTRQYARRQLSWFRNQLPEGGVLRLDARRPEDELVEAVRRVWRAGTEGIQDDEGGKG